MSKICMELWLQLRDRFQLGIKLGQACKATSQAMSRVLLELRRVLPRKALLERLF